MRFYWVFHQNRVKTSLSEEKWRIVNRYCNGDFHRPSSHAVSERRDSTPKSVHTSLNEVLLDGFRSISVENVVNGVLSGVSGILTQRESCFTSRSNSTLILDSWHCTLHCSPSKIVSFCGSNPTFCGSANQKYPTLMRNALEIKSKTGCSWGESTLVSEISPLQPFSSCES